MKKGLSLFLALLMVVLVFSPAFPSLGILASAADGDPVELAFNNLFVFEKWATNKNSTTEQVLHSDGTVTIDGATLTTDIANGSFTLKKESMDTTEVYTAFSASTTDANYNATYYMMDVEPNTEYVFSYHVTGTAWVFTPYIFYYDQDGLWIENGLNAFATPQFETNNFKFTTPANAGKIQVRFTVGDNTGAGNTSQTSVYSTVKNIAIYKADVYNEYIAAQQEAIATQNLFSFEDWKNNPYSNANSTLSPDNGSVVVEGDTIKLTCTSGNFWTGLGIATDASNNQYYTMAVDPSKSYTLSYDVTNISLPAPVHCQPWIIELDSNGICVTFYQNDQNLVYGNNKWTISNLQANTARVQVVFSIAGVSQEASCIVSNIGFYETSVLNSVNYSADYTTVTGLPHRMNFVEGDGTYGTLPVPAAPDGKVFAGWYTGEDGSGKLITSDTEISYESYTVYPKFETEIDAGSLKVITPPTKTTYTVGEKFNPAGLVLQATVTTTDETTNEELKNTYNITSGFIYSPQTVGTTAGDQNITIKYGGQTVEVPITVVDSIQKTVTLNTVQTTVDVTNNEYTLNLTADFNRYELTYYSNSYVKATLNTVAADNAIVSEEFFLEPSDNGSFVSYIDGFLESIKYTNIATIKFEALDKEFGAFELYTVDTILAGVPTDNMQYQQDDTHKVGIDLSKGGSLTYLEELSGDVVAVAYGEGTAAEVDYQSMIDTTGGTVITEGINLINRHDPGRYVQQSYYGTREDPYVTGDYNGVTWNYNPVQGGNYQFESSKIIDFRITTNQIYVKTRPLDWGKYSDEYANSEEGDFVDNDNDGVYEEADGDLMLDPRYGDDYITDSYMEAWYVFEDDTVKTYCRFVDYSGYPSATTTQELPAFYCVEPLNTFAYYNATTVWEEEPSYDYANEAVKIVEPDFWGVSAKYNNMLIANGQSAINPSVNSKENWAAFMSSNNENSFGIGIYSAGVTNFHYGTYPQIYKEPASGSTTMTEQFDNADMYEGGVLTMPSEQDATSYIAPVDTMHFESYKPVTYSYYIATGNLHDIREDFRRAVEKDEAATAAQTVIAVPETAYMEGADGASKVGKYYVNNIINDATNSIETVAERADEMSFSVHIDGATKFTVDITNVTKPSDDIDLYTKDGVEVSNTTKLDLAQNTNTGVFDGTHYLAFNTTGLSFGEKATAKWTITGYDENGDVVGTYIAYTVLYASERTVGAVAESRKEDISQNEISSWITGANGVDHSQRAPLGSFHGDKSASGYFKEDPLVYDAPLTNIESTGETANDLINVANEYSDNAYVLQTATNGHDHSRAQSYLGLLRVDKSRYTNTNQIPNLKIGYDVLRVGSNAGRSLADYYTLYTLGTSDSFTSTDVRERPSGWTTFATTTTSDSSIPVRETVIPEFAVSDIDGKYIHALNQARCWYISNLGESTGNSMDLNSYATAGTSLLCSLTDKGTLRDTVTQGYGLAEEKYSEDSYAKFEEALEKAGTVLGDPSITQEEIDKAQKDLSDAMDTLVNIYYSLKYDNIFSAYEFSQCTSSMTVVASRGTVAYNNGTITVTNAELTDANETYTNYGSADGFYQVALKPNTEYIFEYDVTTTVKSQAFMFFYNASGGAADVPTNMSVKTDGGAWASKTESNAWWGNTNKDTGKYAIKFTTGANTVAAGFRFGNSGNAATESTFSNIRLIESDKYYADAKYSKTEDVYKEHASYGTMVTPTRVGYTFTGWQDVNGTAVTGADIATENKSVYSQWNENNYTIKFNANGGTGSIADKTVKYTEGVTLPSTGVTNTENKLVLKGWATTSDATEPTYQLGQTVSKLTSTNNDTITLYAVWGTVGPVNVTFDNLIDISAWSNSVNNGTLVNDTDTGFTVKSNADAGEATCSSAYFTVEAGHKYIIEADIKGTGWDIYIFFHNETSTGTGLGFADGTSRMASGVNVSEVNGIKYTSTEFTAPAGATKAHLRVDANNGNNAIRFENIRVYDVTERTYLETVNKFVEYGEAYGKLPVPVKEGQQFLGWVDENGNTVTAGSLMESASTVYLKSTWTTNPNTVNDDTVVIEYGLPVVINVLSNDKAGSVVGGVGTTGLSDGDLGSRSHTSSILTDKASSLTLANGKVELNTDGTITYTSTKTNVTTEEVFYYEAVIDGAYYYAKVTVIPATTIYYEDTFFTFENSSVTKNGKTYNYNWEVVGASDGEAVQDTDRPGAFNFDDDANNVYGYDTTFDTKVAYSGGTAHFVKVDQIAGSKVPKAIFTFTGTGFDLFSATDNKSGTITTTIYKGTEIDSSKRVQGIMTNTYFGYAYDATSGEYVPADNGALFQVPVIRARNLSYDTYTVVVEPRYNKAFDVAGSGECGIYVDSVRIYDPMGGGNAVANEAYKADGEYAPQYLEIRDTLVKAKGDGTFDINDLGQSTSVFLDGGRTSLEDFAKLGPKNEVYLGQNDAVTFHIVTDRAELPSTIQIGMSLTGKGGSSADVKLMNTDYNSWVENITLNSTSERYYNIEAVVDWVEQDDGTYKTAAPVIVTNTSEAIISLTSIKWAFNSEDNVATVLDLVTDEMTPKLAMAALNRALTPEVTPQQTILNKDNISFEFTGEPYALGDSGVLTITTEQGVSGVVVNGTDVFNCEVNEDGKLEWVFEFDADSTGSMTFEIIARDEQGFTSESIYATTNVENDTDDGEDTPAQPDDGESDDNTGDSGNNNVVTGPESFVTTLLNGIFNIIRKILGLILGGATV